MIESIIVEDAQEHNLKNVCVTLPKNKLIVITGLSGSGKSSLAFDTIYAEGQRRYMESLSTYARQFLQLSQKPKVGSISGLSPAISIEQKTTSKNPRSTVGTITEIYDYMRILWSRVGVAYSPTTGLPITAQTITQMIDQLTALKQGTRILLLSPVIRGRKGEHKKDIMTLRKKGFQRLKVDGHIYDMDDLPHLDKNIKHDISVVVDRCVIKDGCEKRLYDSLRTALDLSNALAIVECVNDEKTFVFSQHFSCPESNFTIEEMEPRLFSFNNPFGACLTCNGLGKIKDFDVNLIVPNPHLSIEDGAIKPWAQKHKEDFLQLIKAQYSHMNIDFQQPFFKLSQDQKHELFYGPSQKKKSSSFKGIIPALKDQLKRTRRPWQIEQYQSATLCSSCQGNRLKPEALCVKIKEKNIAQATHMSIEQAHEWFQSLMAQWNEKDQKIAQPLIKEINARLSFLMNVGLSYLSLSRYSETLSGGESQRIRLASQIGSGLTGVLYVLDEPSIGLHQRDNDQLLATLKDLRDLGNTIIVVEHDQDAITQADYIVDMGPEAGEKGGYIVAQGSAEDICQNPHSITGQYMNGNQKIPVPKKRRKGSGEKIQLMGACSNNLKNVHAKFPLGSFICVTGVSGSGKSTLIMDTLYKALAKNLQQNNHVPGKYKTLKGLENIDKIIHITQDPIGRTPRSNPATYTGAFTPIREWFAQLPQSKESGYKSGQFSFNTKGGRCEACQGDGVIKIEMHFLPDVYVQCNECKGHRYDGDTLTITFQGKNISDVLNMSVDEALIFFKNIPSISKKIQSLQDVGLGYIRLGQQATTLSGGEAQRIKLAKELSRVSTGRTFYIFDEPTTGLHFHDIKKLLDILHQLVDKKNTVCVIEHNLDVIKTADWIIDMGPEGGEKGGNILQQSSPEKITTCSQSHTGKYLKPYLD